MLNLPPPPPPRDFQHFLVQSQGLVRGGDSLPIELEKIESYIYETDFAPGLSQKYHF